MKNEATNFLIDNQKKLFEVCRYLTKNQIAAQELLQECNEKILLLISEGKVSEKLNVTFYQRVIRNHFYDTYREKRAKKRLCLKTVEITNHNLNIPQPAPEDMRDLHSIETIIDKAAVLTPEAALIVKARMNGTKFKDIAKNFGWNVNTIRPYYQRMLERMKLYLTEEDFYIQPLTQAA